MAAIGLSVGCGEEADPYGEACADADGDGVFSGCEMYDTATPGPDCNDDATDPHAADNWESCDQCVDADGDGVFVGCDQYEVIEGPDCSDVAGDVFSAANWEQCETCVDADGDGAYAGCDAYSEDGTGLWEDEDDSTFELLILVEEGLDVSLRESLDVYRADLRAQGLDSRVDVWTSGSVESLRETLQEMERNWSIDGVFLVGALPAARYQAYNFGEYEEFPTDIFLQAFSVHWTDNNGDGRYDAHSTMTGMGFGLDLYLSRLTGDVSEMRSYFERVHTYKTEGPLLDPSMFIFIDEDWQHPAYGFVGQTWGLHPIYSSFVRMEDPASTTRDAYLNRMTTLGGGQAKTPKFRPGR